jgi:hypothetical protein
MAHPDPLWTAILDPDTAGLLSLGLGLVMLIFASNYLERNMKLKGGFAKLLYVALVFVNLAIAFGGCSVADTLFRGRERAVTQSSD